MLVNIKFDCSEIEKAVNELFLTEPSIFHSLDNGGISDLLCLPNVLRLSNSKPTLSTSGFNVVTVKVEFNGELKTLIAALGTC